MSYPKRVAENILPRSVSDRLPAAFKEWSFTESVRDHEEPVADCELCDQERLRYHYEIHNPQTCNHLWVGSQCILRFGVSVYDKGRVLTPSEAKRKLNQLEQKMRLDYCLRALESLAHADGGDILRNALSYYRRNNFLTPKQAFVVLWQLKEHAIDHSPTFFKVDLRRSQCQAALGSMKLSRVHVIWPALSASQRKMAIAMGHQPPSTC